MTQSEPQFTWVPFYEGFATKLLEYKDRRRELITAVQNALSAVKSAARFEEEDICPFTVMALLNRGNSKWPNRTIIAESLNRSLEMGLDFPADYQGVPVLQAQQWWFFDYASGRQDGDIDSLWQLFEDALVLHRTDNDGARAAFAVSFDAALQVKKTGIKSLTMGLYWMRPDRFVALDENNTQYIRRHFRDVRIYRGTPNGAEYLDLCDDLSSGIPTTVEGYLVEKFYHLSQAAWEEAQSPRALIEGERKRLEESPDNDVSDSLQDRRRQARAIAIRQGQSGFRKKLLKAYDGRCAITGYDVKDALDACHIRTFSGKDDNRESNGVLLRADIHNLFDAHLLGIDPNTGEVWIGTELKGTEYAKLEGKKVRVPEKPTHKPKAGALRERWEKAIELGRFN